MVGISVGGAVTLSSGATIPFSTDVPRDLLRRVATDAGYVRVDGSALSILAPQALYVSLVAEAMRDRSEHTPDGTPIAVAVPGWWTPRACARVEAEFVRQGIDVVLVNDAEAAVAECGRAGLPLPGTVAVVSLRAEQTSVVIVRDCTERPTAVTSPTGVLEEGGSHLDAAVLRHLVGGLAGLGTDVDVTDAAVVAAARIALAQSRALREDLSTTVTESVLPALPGSDRQLRVVRSEIEEIARPWVDSVVQTLSSVIAQCGVPVDAVLLSGGLANMPLVSQRVSADLALETFVPEEPALIAARGADLLMGSRSADEPRQLFATWRRTGARMLTAARMLPRRPAEPAAEHTVTHAIDEQLFSIFTAEDSPRRVRDEPDETCEAHRAERFVGAGER